MRPIRFACVALACAGATVLLASPAALGSGKGSDIGGPVDEGAAARRRGGLDPESLSDEQKAERLKVISREYDELKRNQDILQVRKRRNRVAFVGLMRYPESAKFLRGVFDDDRDDRTRVAALVAIGQAGDPETIQYAVKKCQAIAKKEPVFCLSLPRMFREVRDEESRKWLAERLSAKEPDVLAALIEAVGYTENPEVAEELLKIYDRNKEVEIRFECLRAYGRCAKTDAVSKLLSKLADEDWRIRMAAAEGLRFAGEPRVLPELARLLIEGEVPIVIETATEAVGELGTKDAIPLLIQSLQVGQLRCRQKAREYLKRLARELYRQRKDYFTDPVAWENWWKKAKRTPVGQPPDGEGTGAPERETMAYHGIKIHSDRVLFILDISGSMKWPDPPKELDIRPADWTQRRIDLAHRELFKTLRMLSPETHFNLATFAGVVTSWQPESLEVPATKENVEAGIEWIQKQLPRGGTATYDALEYGILKTNADTVYFLSDGLPSLGRFEEHETILAEVRKINRFRRVSINTIALIIGKSPIQKSLKYEDPEEMGDFMARIAEENWGRFADESTQ